MVARQDLEVLSAWVRSEIKKLGSQNKLAQRLGVSHPTITKWIRGNLKNGLDDSSIVAIASYRGETPESVRRWIEGSKNSTSHPLLDAVQHAPIEVLVEALEVALRRMNRDMTIAELLRLEFAQKGLDPFDETNFQEFALCGVWEDENRDRLRRFITGEECPTDDDLPALADTLETFTGKRFTQQQLQAIKNSHHRNGNGSTNGRV